MIIMSTLEKRILNKVVIILSIVLVKNHGCLVVKIFIVIMGKNNAIILARITDGYIGENLRQCIG